MAAPPPSRWIALPNLTTVPPVPDPDLYVQTWRLQEDDKFRVELRPNVTVGQADVVREHSCGGRQSLEEAFDRYRARLLWQMLKRTWYSTLTDFNTEMLFSRWHPRYFVSLVHRIVTRWDELMAAAGDPGDEHSLAALHAEGAIRLMLKGGNSVAMIKHQALQLLPEAARRCLSSMRPSSLSDLDFLVLVDPTHSAWLADPKNFADVHHRSLVICEGLLHNLSHDIMGGVADNDPDFANFNTLMREIEQRPEQMSKGLRERCDRATRLLMEQLDTAAASQCAPDWLRRQVRAQLDSSLFDARPQDAQISLLLAPRQSLRIVPSSAEPPSGSYAEQGRGGVGGGQLEVYGESKTVFVSRNERVVRACLCLYLSVSLSLCRCLSVCISVFISVSLSSSLVFISVSVSVSLCICLSVYVYVSLYLCLSGKWSN